MPDHFWIGVFDRRTVCAGPRLVAWAHSSPRSGCRRLTCRGS